MKVPYLHSERIIVSEDFIAKNNLSLKPSKEIKAQYELEKKEDFFGFAAQVYIPLLDWEDGKDYYKEEYAELISSGMVEYKRPNITEVAQDFLDYMNFAWDKAEKRRGISASRSVLKLSAMLWSMSHPDLAKEIQKQELYNPYGAPALIMVCEKMGIPVPDSLRDFAKNPL